MHIRKSKRNNIERIRRENTHSGQNTYLYHHGIKGMRWGVRRYQNRDGSLTAMGRRRRAQSDYAIKKASDTSSKRLHVDKKKAAIIGATATVAALTAIGGVYLYKTGALSAIGRKTMTAMDLSKMGIKVAEINRIDVNRIPI